MTKEPVSDNEVVDAFTLYWSLQLSQIKIPIYELDGQHDRLLCQQNILTGLPDCNQIASPTNLSLLSQFYTQSTGKYRS